MLSYTGSAATRRRLSLCPVQRSTSARPACGRARRATSPAKRAAAVAGNSPSPPRPRERGLNDACHALPSDAMLAAETDTEADAAPIGAAHWDLARDLRRRIAADDEAYLRAVHAISQPVIERLRRYPGRSLRPAMLADFVQQWISTEHRLYRLDLHAKLERVRATLTERRLCASTVRRVDDPLSSEDDIAANEIELIVDRADVRLHRAASARSACTRSHATCSGPARPTRKRCCGIWIWSRRSIAAGLFPGLGSKWPPMRMVAAGADGQSCRMVCPCWQCAHGCRNRGGGRRDAGVARAGEMGPRASPMTGRASPCATGGPMATTHYRPVPRRWMTVRRVPVVVPADRV